MPSPCFPSQLERYDFSDEERAYLWKYAKNEYIDKGVTDLSSAVHGVARDLGLKPDWVLRAFDERKSPFRQVTNEVYTRMSDYRKVVQNAHQTVRSIDAPLWKKAIRGALYLPFKAAVSLHGTVGMETHAGGRMFLPSQWDHYWKGFVRQWPMWLSRSFHEKAIQTMIHDPQYTLALRSGLAVEMDSAHIKTDYELYAKKFGNVGGAIGRIAFGGHGFDALKVYRLESFKHAIEDTPAHIRNDPESFAQWSKGQAAIVNQATGVADVGHGTFADIARKSFFAPGLVVSRWGRVIGDPIQVLDTLFDQKNHTPVERQLALQKAKNAAQFTATYIGAMIANQAMLKALGSNQNVNFTDPTKSDWLKFKAFGKNIALDGGLLDPIRLIGKIVVKDLISKQSKFDRGKSRFGMAGGDVTDYLRGKLSPTLGIITDEATGSDFVGRPVPRPFIANEKPKFKDQAAYTGTEYALSRGPIFMTGATKEIFDAMREQGMQAGQVTAFIRALQQHGGAMAGETALGMTGAHEGKDWQAGKPAKMMH